MKPLLIGLAVAGGIWLYQGGFDDLTGSGGSTGDKTVDFANDDPRVNAAYTDARASLPLFLANTTDANGDGIGNAIVKVSFDVGNGMDEIIWVDRFEWDGQTQMAGFLANQPNMMGELNQGDRVEFTTAMVRDWSYPSADGVLWGNYTTRVMLPELEADYAAVVKDMLSADPVPAEWQ